LGALDVQEIAHLPNIQHQWICLVHGFSLGPDGAIAAAFLYYTKYPQIAE
jgi:hypothetical protein